MSRRLRGRICIIGAGIFGSTIAFVLARDGWHVRLVDQASSICSGASGNNLFRLHHGYHYPRSLATAKESFEASTLFLEEYDAAVLAGIPHYYAVAKSGSKINASEFINHCNLLGLSIQDASSADISFDHIEQLFLVDESRLDISILKNEIMSRLIRENVEISLNSRFRLDDYGNYDFYIIAANSGNSDVLNKFGFVYPARQYELCEVAVLDFSDLQFNFDLVVLDGDFISFSPFGVSSKYLLYHVKHSVLYREISKSLSLPGEFQSLVNNCGITFVPHFSRYREMLSEAAKFIPKLSNACYAGSLFSVRSTLPNVDNTDERPSFVEWHSSNVLSVFSGKIVTAVKVARQVRDQINIACGYVE